MVLAIDPNRTIIMHMPFSVSLKLDDKDYSVLYKKSLKIPKGQSKSVYRRRTDNTMAKRKSTKGQTTIYKTYL
jgi:hypothetical protein